MSCRLSVSSVVFPSTLELLVASAPFVLSVPCTSGVGHTLQNSQVSDSDVRDALSVNGLSDSVGVQLPPLFVNEEEDETMKIVKRVARPGAASQRWARPRLSRWMHKWAQRRFVWAGSVILLAATTGLVVASITATAVEERASWGEVVRVAVASQSIAVGDTVAGAISWKEYPAAVVPRSAVTSLSGDDVAAAQVGSGEIVVATDLMSASAGLGAQLSPGRSAMALPRVVGWPSLVVGDQVALLATSPTSPAATVTSKAVVLQSNDDEVTVSIVSDDAPGVANALSRGQVIAVLVPRR